MWYFHTSKIIKVLLFCSRIFTKKPWCNYILYIKVIEKKWVWIFVSWDPVSSLIKNLGKNVKTIRCKYKPCTYPYLMSSFCSLHIWFIFVTTVIRICIRIWYYPCPTLAWEKNMVQDVKRALPVSFHPFTQLASQKVARKKKKKR